MIPSIEETVGLMADLHSGQRDKAGTPYWRHPLAVMRGLPAWAPPIARHTALPHDTGEDCWERIRDIMNWPEGTPFSPGDFSSFLCSLGYPDAVVRSVLALTRVGDRFWKIGRGQAPAEMAGTYQDYVDAIAESDDLVTIVVKRSDADHNLDARRLRQPGRSAEEQLSRALRYGPVITKMDRALARMGFEWPRPVTEMDI